MSEASQIPLPSVNGSTFISDGKQEFVLPDGTSFRLDLIEACEEINRLAEKYKDDKGFAHLNDFAGWIHQKVELIITLGVADELWRAVQLRYAATRKSFTDALKSLSSTESTSEI